MIDSDDDGDLDNHSQVPVSKEMIKDPLDHELLRQLFTPSRSDEFRSNEPMSAVMDLCHANPNEAAWLADPSDGHVDHYVTALNDREGDTRALLDEHQRGFALYTLHDHQSSIPEAHLLFLLVDAKHRRQGIATSLLVRLQQLRVSKIILEVSPPRHLEFSERKQAKAQLSTMYAKHGFVDDVYMLGGYVRKPVMIWTAPTPCV